LPARASRTNPKAMLFQTYSRATGQSFIIYERRSREP
jgi:hypothetical protein